MTNGIVKVPAPKNEPILNYGPGSKEKAELKSKMTEMLGQEVEIPVLVGDKEIYGNRFQSCPGPHATDIHETIPDLLDARSVRVPDPFGNRFRIFFD